MSAQPDTSPVRGPRHPEHMSLFERSELGSMQPLKFVLNWGRRYSPWLLNFGLPCCGIGRRGLFRVSSGGRGIRTREAVAHLHALQACPFVRSGRPPRRV